MSELTVFHTMRAKSFLTKSLLYVLFLRRKVFVGKNVEFSSLPNLIIDHESEIYFGASSICRKMVEIRSLKASVVRIGRGCRIDNLVRLLSTNQSNLTIGEGSRIGLGTIMNGGCNITIGRNVLISGFVYLQTSAHRTSKSKKIMEQGFDHAPIVIEDDVWIGAHCIILPGVTLKKGSVIGANSVVKKDTEEFSISAGSPAKLISHRK